MFKKEIDEIYELCKRVANEVPTANASFNYSIYGMSVCGLKKKVVKVSIKSKLSCWNF